MTNLKQSNGYKKAGSKMKSRFGESTLQRRNTVKLGTSPSEAQWRDYIVHEYSRNWYNNTCVTRPLRKVRVAHKKAIALLMHETDEVTTNLKPSLSWRGRL